MGMPVITPGTITRDESVGAIIESIALEESGIAHNLNAESKKMQKISASSNTTVQDLPTANKSVKNAVDTVNGLEIVSKVKLAMCESTNCQAN